MAKGIRIGAVWIDGLTLKEAIGRVARLVADRKGGVVYTPNVDHIVLAESNEAFRDAYRHANLSLADGMPLVWLARLVGRPLPERVAGSDLFVPLMATAAEGRWRVYLVGAAPEVLKKAAGMLSRRMNV